MPVKIDIIILSYAKSQKLKDLTIQTVETLLNSENPEYITFNIIVIESNKLLKPYKYANTTTIYPNKKFGFNTYLNVGLSVTSANYVCLCNNDVMFFKNWATEILKAMNNDSSLLSASPICPTSHPIHGFEINSGNYYGKRVGKEVAGWCILLKRNVLEIIGKLDEKIKFWYADNDYANLLENHKIKHALISSSIAKHLVESTKSSLDYLSQHKYTNGSFLYYDYKWNHKNYFLYAIRSVRFAFFYEARRLKRFIKAKNIANT